MNKSALQSNIRKFPSVVYHYCSLKNLCSILSSGELWMGNTISMNDAKEQLYFIENFFYEVKNNLPLTKHGKCDEMMQKTIAALETDRSYVFCLSALKDDAAQWERYADNAQGVAIGFDSQKLECFFNKFGLFYNVVYYYDIKSHDIFSILKQYLEKGALPASFTTEQGIIDNIIACSSRFKHEGFASEQELRVTVLSIVALSNDVYKPAYKQINNVVKNVLKVDLKQLGAKNNIQFENIINSITLGPRSHQSESTFKAYVSSLGYANLAETVQQSKCPLR